MRQWRNWEPGGQRCCVRTGHQTEDVHRNADMAQHEAADAQGEDRGGRRDEDDGGHAAEHGVAGVGHGGRHDEWVGKVCLFIRSNSARWRTFSVAAAEERGAIRGEARPGRRVGGDDQQRW